MQTKTLGTIQTLAKIGRVLSKIVFIFSLIGAIGCAAGILSVRFLPESIQLGKTTIQGLVELTDELTPAVAYAAMLTAGIICLGEAVLAKIAERYFKRELSDGTPFTFDGAKALMRLGVMMIVAGLLCRHGAELSQGKDA